MPPGTINTVVSDIKHEPGAPRVSNGRICTLQQAHIAPSGAASSAASTLAVSQGTRNARSNAPTAQTHPILVDLTESEADDDEPQLREVRAKPIKPDPDMADNVNVLSFTAIEGDMDKNLKHIGQHFKKLNDTLGSLQQLGIHHDTPLPELILVGDQSSGKSSLMSAISQIVLPRSDGVCTRCPIHIRLSSDTSWRCRVTLQQDFAYRPTNNEPITEADVTDENLFPPWVRQQREVKEFKMIFDKTEPIDEIVRWAQIAILNHNRNFENFIPNDQRTAQDLTIAEEETEAKFSPNTVAIEVKGPNLPDLSFYDMPGVFSNARHEEDQFLVKVVENLVQNYVRHEKAIILWAVPMNNDPETSSTFTLIRRLRAQKRTIGVMTKADLLPRGNSGQWLAMLRNKTHQVGHGYFVTSRAAQTSVADDGDQGSQQRDRMNLRDESAAEEAFFNRRGGSGEWPREFDGFEDRCGIDELVKFLAQTLAQEFAQNLPELSWKLREKLDNTHLELQKLPEKPQNPEAKINRSLFKFTNNFQARVKSKAFSSSWGKVAETFKSRILELKPRYRLVPNGFRLEPRDGFGVSDRESSLGINYSPTLSVKRPHPIDLTTEVSMSQRRRLENGKVNMEDHARINDRPVPFPSLATPNAHLRAPAKSLAQLRNRILSEREAGKPGEVPYEVKEALAMEAIKPWAGPLCTFLNDTMKHVREELTESLNESFKELKKRQVYTKARKWTTEWLAEHKARANEQLHKIYQMEASKVYTMDEETFHRHRLDEAHLLKRNRHFYRWKAHIGDTSHEMLEDWDKLSADARRKEEQKMLKEAALLGDDPYEPELAVAAHVRGYYLTAAMRFIDISAMHIFSGLFRDLHADIEHYLEKKLGLDQRDLDKELFEALMEEEQSTSEKRIRLRAELERFDKAVREIDALNKTVQASANGTAPPAHQLDTSMEDAEMDIVADEF